MEKWKGIFPALLTPYTRENKISEKSLEAIVKMNLERGVKGFYIGGSTAEAFLLSAEERKYLLDIVADAAKGKCTLIYHIGCIGTDQAIELGMYAKKVGVDAISSVPPFYYPFSFEEIKNYYFDLVNAIDLPMLVYNFPALSGVTLTSDHIKELSADSRIIGVKHTSMDLYQLEQMKAANEKLILYNGHDEVCLGGLSMGADGAIGSTFNFMADRFVGIKAFYDQGKLDEARALQKSANEIIAVLIKTGVFRGIKYILGQMGIECGDCRKPFSPLTEESKALLDSMIEKYKLIG